jgi:transposase InsO family protein
MRRFGSTRSVGRSGDPPGAAKVLEKREFPGDHRGLRLIVDAPRNATTNGPGRTAVVRETLRGFARRSGSPTGARPRGSSLTCAPSSRRSTAAGNGPELLAWALRDWCRLHGTTTTYIEPGSPWENPFIESFNGRTRDELLNIEEFGTLLEAQVVIEAWRVEYNTYRPHSSLGGLTPAEYAERWTTNQPALP